MKRLVPLAFGGGAVVLVAIAIVIGKSQPEYRIDAAASHWVRDVLTTAARAREATAEYRRVHGTWPASIDDLRSVPVFDTTDMVCRIGDGREPAFASPEWVRDGCIYLRFPSPQTPASDPNSQVTLIVMGCDVFPKRLALYTIGDTMEQYDINEQSHAELATTWEALAPGFRPW